MSYCAVRFRKIACSALPEKYFGNSKWADSFWSARFVVSHERQHRLVALHAAARFAQGWRIKNSTNVATIIPTMTKTIAGLAKLVLFSGGRTGESMVR